MVNNFAVLLNCMQVGRGYVCPSFPFMFGISTGFGFGQFLKYLYLFNIEIYELFGILYYSLLETVINGVM